jgi:hypothetical protein
MTADCSGPNNVWHSRGHIASSDQKFAPDSAVMNKTTTETLCHVRLLFPGSYLIFEEDARIHGILCEVLPDTECDDKKCSNYYSCDNLG